MEFRKRDIINILFVAAFPIYGVGKYIAQIGNFSVGQITSVLPCLIILLFYVVDIIYKKEVKWSVNFNYILVLAFCVLSLTSLQKAFAGGIPGLNDINTITLSIFLIAFIHAPIVVQFYNYEDGFSVQHLLYLGLSCDILLNLLGYGAGLKNAVHSIDGRLNLPFGQGFYAAANTVAIINLLIVGKLMNGVKNNLFRLTLIVQFGINLILMLGFNSRLSMLMFTLVIGLLIIRAWRFYRTVFFMSILTIPFLLNFTEVIYQVLQLPMFRAVLKRVSYEDVTGFNGRRDLWDKGSEWLMTQGEGFLFGNGYRGHYAIRLLEELEQFWFKSSVNMHMHSSLFEFLLSIGVLGVMILFILAFRGLQQISRKAKYKHPDAILLGCIFYVLFVFQIDNYVYMFNYGAFILFTIISSSVVTKTSDIKSWNTLAYQ